MKLTFKQDDEYSLTAKDLKDNSNIAADTELPATQKIRVALTLNDPTQKVFLRWSDGNTEPIRTVAVLQAVNLEAALTDVNIKITQVEAENIGDGKASFTITKKYDDTVLKATEEIYYDEEVYVTINEKKYDGKCYYMTHWSDGNTDNPRLVKAYEVQDLKARYESLSNEVNLGLSVI